jgi:hypothetical protein
VRKKSRTKPPVLVPDITNRLTVSRSEAAAVLGVDIKTIDRAIAAKKLRTADSGIVGDRVLIYVADLQPRQAVA